MSMFTNAFATAFAPATHVCECVCEHICEHVHKCVCARICECVRRRLCERRRLRRHCETEWRAQVEQRVPAEAARAGLRDVDGDVSRRRVGDDARRRQVVRDGLADRQRRRHVPHRRAEGRVARAPPGVSGGWGAGGGGGGEYGGRAG